MTHGACCRVAWIHECFFAFSALANFLSLPLIQLFEVCTAHVDLTANFKDAGHFGRQLKRYLSNGSNVVRHIFTEFAIAPSCRLNQGSFFITKTHGQAIKFEFSHIRNSRRQFVQAQFFANPRVKGDCTTRLRVCFGSNAEHRHLMAHSLKLWQYRTPYALCG